MSANRSFHKRFIFSFSSATSSADSFLADVSRQLIADPIRFKFAESARKYIPTVNRQINLLYIRVIFRL